MRSVRTALPVALALIALAACSSDESSSSPTTDVAPGTTAAAATAPSSTAPPTTAPAPSTIVASTLPATTSPAPTPTTVVASTLPSGSVPATTEAPATDDELTALAESALIDLSVFPDGWTESPREPDDEPSDDEPSDDDAFEQQVDECLGIDENDDESDLLEAREARSGEFADTEAQNQPSVEHVVTVADDEAMAVRAMARAGTDGAAGCLEETLQTFFDADPEFQDDESGIELGALTVTRLELEGDPTGRVGYRIEIPLSLGDQTFIQYLEVLYQRQGRALSQLQFASFGVPFPDEGFVSLSDDVTIRLATIGS